MQFENESEIYSQTILSEWPEGHKISHLHFPRGMYWGKLFSLSSVQTNNCYFEI